MCGFKNKLCFIPVYYNLVTLENIYNSGIVEGIDGGQKSFYMYVAMIVYIIYIYIYILVM